MAAFEPAFRATMGEEGGYANDPSDRGGETYRGIARRWHKTWSGWAVIDRVKRGGKAAIAAAHDELAPHVEQFYRAVFWEPLGGDELADQRIADELFDTAVNMAPTAALGFLQRTLNVLNRCGALYPDIQEDGSWGRQTRDALCALLRHDPPELVLTALNALQGARYIEIARKDPTQEKYMRGWLRRVTLRGAPGTTG